jgi:hydrogenase maturation protease
MYGVRLPCFRSFRTEDRSDEDPVKRALIGGIGNVLLGDDAVGPYIVRVLESLYKFDNSIEISDLGTPSLDLTQRIAGLNTVILVDCVACDEPAGSVMLFDKAVIIGEAPSPRLDPHSPALSECLLSAEMLGCSPEHVLLVGIVGKTFEPGHPLSDAVQKSVGEAIETILSEMKRLGFGFKRRLTIQKPDLWWCDTNSGSVACC